LTFHVHGDGDFHAGSTDWQGSIESRGLALQFAFLNQPVVLPDALLDLGPGAAQKLTLTAAQGFDAIWTGTIFRSAAHPGWQFDLTADRLDAAALDRWIEPRARNAGLLERLGLFSSGPDSSGADEAAAASAVPVRARGRVRVGEFVLAPLRLAQLDADVELNAKTIDVDRAKTSFAGGSVEGQFTAALGAVPEYDARVRFDRVDFATLAQNVPSLQGKLDGAAAGELTLHATGIGRDALLDSLVGQGSIAARNFQIRGFNLAMLRADEPPIDDEHFASAQAEFRIEGRNIRAAPVRLTKSGESILAAGSVDFEGSLDFRIDVSASPQAASVRVAGPAIFADPEASPASAYRLTGSVAAPQLAPYRPTATPPALPSAARGAGRGAQR
jgi:hypothetical protein